MPSKIRRSLSEDKAQDSPFTMHLMFYQPCLEEIWSSYISEVQVASLVVAKLPAGKHTGLWGVMWCG